MREGARRPALAGWAPTRREDRAARGFALFFDPGGPRWPGDAAEPSRRRPSPQATFWSWTAIAVLVAALVLPFSLAAVIDLVRYLGR